MRGWVIAALALALCGAAAGQVTDQGLYRHTMGVTPSNGGVTGVFRFYEPYGLGGHSAGFRAPGSLAADLVWTLPSTDSSGAQCLASNGSGVLGWASCSGAGSTLPVVDSTAVVKGSSDASKLLRFEVDHFTSGVTRTAWVPDVADAFLAATNVAGTWTANQVMQSVFAAADSTYVVGASAVRFSEGWFDDVTTEEVYFRRQGAGSQDFAFSNTSANILNVTDAGGTQRLQLHTVSAPQFRVGADLLPHSTGTWKLGASTSVWTESHVMNGYVTVALLPDISAGADVGSASLRFNGHFDDITMYNSPVIQSDFALSGTLGTASKLWGVVYTSQINMGQASTSSGAMDFYVSTLATSADVRAEDVSSVIRLSIDKDVIPRTSGTYDLGMASRTWNDVYADIIRATTGYIGPGGVGGTTSTLTCGSGQAVKNITVVGGIVSAVSCGAP